MRAKSTPMVDNASSSLAGGEKIIGIMVLSLSRCKPNLPIPAPKHNAKGREPTSSLPLPTNHRSFLGPLIS